MDALLSLVHVGAAVVWAGGAFVMAWFLQPAARAAGPAAGPFMAALIQRTKLPETMRWASTIAVLAGIAMWWSRYGLALPPGYRGVSLAIGALAGLTALGLAQVQLANAGRMRKVLMAVGAGPPTPEQAGELDELGTHVAAAAKRLAWAMVVAVAGMAFAG